MQRHADFGSLNTLRHKGEEFLTITVHDEYGSPVHVDFLADNLQDNSRQFGEVNGGVQKLRGFQQPAQAIGASSCFNLGKCRLRHKAANNAALDTLDVIGSRRELGDGLLNPQTRTIRPRLLGFPVWGLSSPS